MCYTVAAVSIFFSVGTITYWMVLGAGGTSFIFWVSLDGQLLVLLLLLLWGGHLLLLSISTTERSIS